MCGISGIYSFNKSINIDQIKKMTNAIVHRGPDGEDQWINANASIGLGHRRLSILDLSSAGAQPMHSPCGRYTIVFNGEIYNYLELRAELEKTGEFFLTQTDTEVLLRLFILQKEKCLDQLDGMWAFAVWDENKQELFCARDRFGEKPFHYYLDKNAFYFSSEMKSLWEVGVPKTANMEMFDHFAKTGKSINYSKLNDTFYTSIFRLENSHWMKVKSNGETEIQRYYDIDWKNQNFKGSLLEAQKQFKSLFIESLKRRLRSDVPIGTSLSGGLDSSTIVCAIANQNSGQNLTAHSFSARFKNFTKDEGFFIQKVIDRTGVVNHTTWPNGQSFEEDIDNLCLAQEEPFGGASIYAQYCVQQLAKQTNVTVLIDGQGADEFLAGYIYYYGVYINQLHANKSSVAKRLAEQRAFVNFHTPHTRFKKFGINASYMYERRGRKAKNGNFPTSESNLAESLYLSTMKGPLQELLRFADRNSMAHSIEVRLPFLNRELVEFCFSLPDEYKLKLGWTKYILRKSFEDILPKEITWRKEKVGFEPPQLEWMKNFSEKNWNTFIAEKFLK